MGFNGGGGATDPPERHSRFGVDAEEDGWSLYVEQCCSFRSVALSLPCCSLKAKTEVCVLVEESRLSGCCRCSPPRRGLVLVAVAAPFCMSLVGV